MFLSRNKKILKNALFIFFWKKAVKSPQHWELHLQTTCLALRHKPRVCYSFILLVTVFHKAHGFSAKTYTCC